MSNIYLLLPKYYTNINPHNKEKGVTEKARYSIILYHSSTIVWSSTSRADCNIHIRQ